MSDSSTTGPSLDNVAVCKEGCYKDFFDIYDILDKSALSTIIALFGFVSNIITLTVIIRQGFSDAINVSLLGLTVSDNGSLTTLLIQNLMANPLIIDYVDTDYSPEGLGFMPATLRYYFSRTTCYITIFILVQRCLCIAIPFKIKSILTTKRSVLSVVAIFIAAFFLNLFVHTSTGDFKIGWIFSPIKNKTLLNLNPNQKWTQLYITSTYISAVSQVTSFIIIVLGTAILVLQLKKKTKWRDSSGAVASNSLKTMSKRDHKLGLMVAFLSGVLIICHTPSTCGVVLSSFVPPVTMMSLNEKEFLFIWSFGTMCEAVHSSVNIFVYYKTSSKYRRTFNSLVCSCINKEAKGNANTSEKNIIKSV